MWKQNEREEFHHSKELLFERVLKGDERGRRDKEEKDHHLFPCINETLKIQKGHFLFPFQNRQICHKEDAKVVYVVVVVYVVIYSPLQGSIVVVVVLLFLGRRFIHSGMGC